MRAGIALITKANFLKNLPHEEVEFPFLRASATTGSLRTPSPVMPSAAAMVPAIFCPFAFAGGPDCLPFGSAFFVAFAAAAGERPAAMDAFALSTLSGLCEYGHAGLLQTPPFTRLGHANKAFSSFVLSLGSFFRIFWMLKPFGLLAEEDDC